MPPSTRSACRSEDLNPIELSGGEQQRLAIARAIVSTRHPDRRRTHRQPRSPTTRSASRERIYRDFNRVGVATLIASHDQELMARYATRTLRIDPGKVLRFARRRHALDVRHRGRA